MTTEKILKIILNMGYFLSKNTLKMYEIFYLETKERKVGNKSDGFSTESSSTVCR